MRSSTLVSVTGSRCTNTLAGTPYSECGGWSRRTARRGCCWGACAGPAQLRDKLKSICFKQRFLARRLCSETRSWGTRGSNPYCDFTSVLQERPNPYCDFTSVLHLSSFNITTYHVLCAFPEHSYTYITHVIIFSRCSALGPTTWIQGESTLSAVKRTKGVVDTIVFWSQSKHKINS